MSDLLPVSGAPLEAYPYKQSLGAGIQEEVKRRTRVVGHFPNETSALSLVFGVIEEKRMSWYKVGMTAEDIAWIEEASRSLEQEPIRLDFLDKVLVD
jgi:transposase-like protein